jgi:hypothetical protein
MEKLKKILLGMGYLTWMICNIAVLYGIGCGVMELLESESVGEFLLKLAGGMVTVLVMVILSILCLGLVAMLFGDQRMESKLDDLFDKVNL